MEEKKELKLEELDSVVGGSSTDTGNGEDNTPTGTASSGNNGGSDTTLPGITFKKK